MSICGSIVTVDIMTTIHAVLMTTSLNTYTGNVATLINIHVTVTQKNCKNRQTKINNDRDETEM